MKKSFVVRRIKKSECELYHCHNFRGVAHNICYLRYNTPKKNPIVFFN